MRRQAGFTMIEVIVIVAVLAILAGVITPLVIREVGKSKVTRAKADMEAISTAFNQYFADTGVWPDAWTGTGSSVSDMTTYTSLYTNSQNVSGWDGPYMERGQSVGGVMRMTAGAVPSMTGMTDPWGHPFRIVYAAPGVNGAGAAGAICIVSAGPNGVHNTSTANARIGTPTQDDIIRVVTRRAR